MHERLFTYDAFISHRTGDGAPALAARLLELGCNVWFDGDVPLKERRLTVISQNFAVSRSIVVYLSPIVASSPWPILEIYAALSTEADGCERTIFFAGDELVLKEAGLPVDLEGVVRERGIYRWSGVATLAREILALNRIPACRFARLDGGTYGNVGSGRELARLISYLDGCRTQLPNSDCDALCCAIIEDGQSIAGELAKDGASAELDLWRLSSSAPSGFWLELSCCRFCGQQVKLA
ncbi:MAG: TIR domain-containing protein [Amaricoccus sp.]|uniref:TIR domain-containing protein n=1 Tax=Amaricoccus sp. TaxID=1872485 RepID=UPI0033155639